jgi:two-component system, NtrC family, response regulator AtoC
MANKLDIRKVASSGQTVLITGRTGTGKSHLAREIHEMHINSSGRTGKFVGINLATLSDNLIESELFGHEKGAFSGASARRIGKLESAQGGTAFLDEIGELSPRLQTKLLETLNSQVVTPVGSNREIQLDLRVIAATNRDLRKMVDSGEFREDLFFRLNVFHIELEGLATAPDRIPGLAAQFAADASKRQGRPYFGMEASFIAALRRHNWPGNVRELKNCMDFSVAMSEGGRLHENCLPNFVSKQETAEVSPMRLFPTDYREAKSSFERVYIREVLRRCAGKINLTAKESGLSKVTLIEKIRRYDIDVNRIKIDCLPVKEAR